MERLLVCIGHKRSCLHGVVHGQNLVSRYPQSSIGRMPQVSLGWSNCSFWWYVLVITWRVFSVVLKKYTWLYLIYVRVLVNDLAVVAVLHKNLFKMAPIERLTSTLVSPCFAAYAPEPSSVVSTRCRRRSAEDSRATCPSSADQLGVEGSSPFSSMIFLETSWNLPASVGFSIYLMTEGYVN